MLAAAREVCDFAASILDGLDCAGFPSDHVLTVLSARLDAPGAVMQRTTWATGETEIVAHGYSDRDVPLMIGATQSMRHSHPLMVAHSQGDLEPSTAQEAAGGWLSWRHSPVRSFLNDLHGWEQMVAIGLRGGSHEVCALAFARPIRDFTEPDLTLLTTVQPFLQAVDRHVVRINRWAQSMGDARQAPSAVRAAGLTARELTVLVLLAEGCTAVAMAHRLGCSPHTVHKHTSSIYRKLGAKDRLTAVLEGQRQGLLPPPNGRRQ